MEHPIVLQLQTALRSENKEIIEELIGQYYLNKVFCFDFICKNCSNEFAEWFLEKITADNITLHYFLETSCYYNCKKLAQIILQKDITNTKWALNGACRGGHKELTEWILSEEGLNCQLEAEQLRLASKNNHFEFIKWLIDEKNAIQFKNDILYGACIGNHQTLIEWTINVIQADYWHPAMFGACQGGNKELAEEIKNCAGIFNKPAFIDEYKNWDTVLSFICEINNFEMVKWVIEGNTNYNFNFVQPLTFACVRGNQEMAEYLIEKSINLGQQLIFDFAFMQGCLRGNRDMIISLIDKYNINNEQLNIETCKELGLEIKVINWDKYSKVEGNCIICHEDGELIQLHCHETHIYHQNCIKTWVDTTYRNSCCLCQTQIN